MSLRLPVVVVAIAAVLTLFFSTSRASAAERAFLTLKGQKSGVIRGDYLSPQNPLYADSFEVHNFSVSPATAGTGPASATMTISYYGLPQIFNSMVTNEVITQATITTEKTDVKTGKLTKEFTVGLLNAHVTDLSFDLAAGGSPVFTFTLGTSAAGSFRYADANGNALTTAVPSVAGAALATTGSNMTFKADKVQTSLAGYAVPIASIAWHVATPAGGVGKPSLLSFTFTHAPDSSSDALKAAAARGDSVAGTKIECLDVSKAGVPTRLFGIEIDNAKLVVPPAPSGSTVDRTSPVLIKAASTTTEKYTVAFGAPPAGSHAVVLTRYDGGVTGAY